MYYWYWGLVHSCENWLCLPVCVPTRSVIHACRYKSGIEQVQPQDVLAAARRRLHPGQQTIVVAGDAKKLRKELAKLGMPIQELKLPK